MVSSYPNVGVVNDVWVIISAIAALICGIVIYFTFLSKKNESKFKGFCEWLYDFLSFKKMVLENILKIAYLISAIFITLLSFAFISVNFLYFIMVLIGGNLLIRVTYEFSLVILVICRNTTEINKKMKKD